MLELTQETVEFFSAPMMVLCLGVAMLFVSIFDSDRQRGKTVAGLSVLICLGAGIVILSAK